MASIFVIGLGCYLVGHYLQCAAHSLSGYSGNYWEGLYIFLLVCFFYVFSKLHNVSWAGDFLMLLPDVGDYVVLWPSMLYVHLLIDPCRVFILQSWRERIAQAILSGSCSAEIVTYEASEVASVT